MKIDIRMTLTTICSAFLCAATFLPAAIAQQQLSPCKIEATVFHGWQAQEISNDWIRLTIVPQLGGRLMQVTFNGHSYLFINPVYQGKYITPTAAAGDWINYGGDKVWPLPEGNEDEQHWTGASTPLDDGPYGFRVLSQGQVCKVRLEGPTDPPTGLQYTREISIGSNSPEISFHAVMKNFTGHLIEWSMQSVSQYNLSDANDPKKFNSNFWAFAPLNAQSSYLLGYHVRDGLANDPSYSAADGLFRLNWKYLESEVWLDSTAGWIALVDGASEYAMVEKTHYIRGAEYPSKASVIFYKNGPVVQMDEQGQAHLSSDDLRKTPYYMEAELNSPMVKLEPGETYGFDSRWFPSRMNRDLTTVTDAGLIGKPLAARRTAGSIELTGSFGVFFSGQLRAFLYGRGGEARGEVAVENVQPQNLIKLRKSISAPENVQRVSVHLIDDSGLDRGPLGEIAVDGGTDGR